MIIIVHNISLQCHFPNNFSLSDKLAIETEEATQTLMLFTARLYNYSVHFVQRGLKEDFNQVNSNRVVIENREQQLSKSY